MSDDPVTIGQRYPATPDGRYFVVRGRLWRCSDPKLAGDERHRLTLALMTARREVGRAKRQGDAAGLLRAREAVDTAKIALGERGPVWWDDGAPDLNRHMARTTGYAAWHAGIDDTGSRRRCADGSPSAAPGPKSAPS